MAACGCCFGGKPTCIRRRSALVGPGAAGRRLLVGAVRRWRRAVVGGFSRLISPLSRPCAWSALGAGTVLVKCRARLGTLEGQTSAVRGIGGERRVAAAVAAATARRGEGIMRKDAKYGEGG